MGTTPARNRILVAVAEDSTEKIVELLGDGFQLQLAKTVQHAHTLLKQSQFDLIVCGVRFDDSRLLDLLQQCKSDPQLASIPFLCMRVLRGKLSLDCLRDIVLASSALGAAGFFDVEQCDRDVGPEATATEYRKLVRSLLEGD